MHQRVAHQLALLDELDLHLVAQAAAVPLAGPGQVGDRQLQVMDPGQGRYVRHAHDPSAQQAAGVEPLIAGFWQQGREQTRHAYAVFWTRMAQDGLLDPAIDLDWLTDTTSILAAAETYLLTTRLTGWDLDTWQHWLATTCARLSAPSPQPPPHTCD